MSRLFINANMQTPDLLNASGCEIAVFSAHAPYKEDGSEDTAAVLEYGERSCILVVADGVGGIPGGAAAAKIAVEQIRNAIRGVQDSNQPPRAAILDGIENANRLILELPGGGASTIAVLAVTPLGVRSFTVGDSMSLVIGGRGRVKHQSISHSPVGYAVEAGLLNEREAMTHDDRHLISNSLGSKEMRMELGTAVQLAARDTLIVGSDGLFDNLYNREIVELVRCGPLAQAAEKLATAALRRMTDPAEGLPSKPDDLTFILCRPGQATRTRRRRSRPASAAFAGSGSTTVRFES